MRTIKKDGLTIKVLQTPKEARKFANAFHSLLDGTPALDFETTALRPDESDDAQVRLTAIATDSETAYVIDHWLCGSFASFCDDLVEKGPYYVFNVNFEGRWFEYEYTGDSVTALTRCLYDVAHMRRSVMGGGPWSLSNMVKRDLKIELDKSLQNSDWSSKELSDKQYFYGGADAIYTKHLGDYWAEEMDDDRWNGFFVINDAWRAVNECEDTGLLLDERHHEKLIDMWHKRRDAAETAFRKYVPADVVPNMRSKKQMSDFLKMILDDEAIASWPATEKTGQLSTKRSVLRGMSFISPYPLSRALACYMVYTRADKYIGTYGETLLTKQRLSRDGRVRGRLNMAAAITGRFSSSNPNCFTGEHELLTKTGWVRMDQYKGGPIAQWWPNGTINWTVPTRFAAVDYAGKLVNIEAAMVSASVTPDHKFISQRRNVQKDFTAGQIASRSGVDGIPTCGKIPDGEITGKEYLQFLVALAADGSVRDGTARFGFKKSRKIARLRALLDSLGYSYTERVEKNGVTSLYLPAQNLPEKGLGPWMLQLSGAEMDVVLDELYFWDGWTHKQAGQKCFCTTNKEEAEWVQTIAHLRNRPVTVKFYENAGRGIYHVYFRKSKYTTIDTERQVTVQDFDGKVYCPTVNSSYVLVRRNGKVYVSKNCQNFPRHPLFRFTFIAGRGRKLILADYSGVEIRVLAEVSGDKVLLHDAIYDDVHSRSAIAIYQIEDADEFIRVLKSKDDADKVAKARAKEMRSKAKAFTFQLLYGAGAGALAIALRCTPDEAQDAINKWAARYSKAYGYRQFMYEKMMHTGFMPCASGRTIFVPKWERSMPVAANYPIQGSAGDVMYRAMYRTQELLDQADIGAKLMVSVHDELLLLAEDVYADAAKEILEKGMLAGWLDIFPNSNTDNLADVVIGTRWSDKA